MSKTSTLTSRCGALMSPVIACPCCVFCDLRCGSCHPAVFFFFFASAGTVDPAGLPSWLEAAKGKKTNRLLNDQTFTSFTCCFRELHVLRTEVSLAMHRLRDEL